MQLDDQLGSTGYLCHSPSFVNHSDSSRTKSSTQRVQGKPWRNFTKGKGGRNNFAALSEGNQNLLGRRIVRFKSYDWREMYDIQ